MMKIIMMTMMVQITVIIVIMMMMRILLPMIMIKIVTVFYKKLKVVFHGASFTVPASGLTISDQFHVKES